MIFPKIWPPTSSKKAGTSPKKWRNDAPVYDDLLRMSLYNTLTFVCCTRDILQYLCKYRKKTSSVIRAMYQSRRFFIRLLLLSTLSCLPNDRENWRCVIIRFVFRDLEKKVGGVWTIFTHSNVKRAAATASQMKLKIVLAKLAAAAATSFSHNWNNYLLKIASKSLAAGSALMSARCSNLTSCLPRVSGGMVVVTRGGFMAENNHKKHYEVSSID